MKYALLALVVIAGVAHAQDARSLPGGGPEVFAGLLEFNGVKPAGSSLDANADILIVFNPPRYDPETALVVETTLKAGKSALLASDRATNWSTYLPAGSVSVSGEQYRAPRDRSWRQNPDYPLALPNPDFSNIGSIDPIDALFRGRLRLATYRPSRLIARSTPGSWVAGPFAHLPTGNQPGESRRAGILALGATRPSGARLLILADPDMLSNALLTAVDANGMPADNLLFANDLVKWLSDNGNRKRCHLIVNGALVTDYDRVRFDAPPPIPLPKIDPLSPGFQRAVTDLGNDALAATESQGAVRKLFEPSKSRFADPPGWLRALIGGSLAGLFAVLLWRLFAAGRKPRDAAPPEVVPPRPASPADLLPAARDYLRLLIVELGREATGRPPKLIGAAARTLTPRFRIVWGVASGRDATPVTPRRWAELAADADELRATFAAGACRFRPGA